MFRDLGSVGITVHTTEMVVEAEGDYGALISFVAPTSNSNGVEPGEQKGVPSFAESCGDAQSRKLRPSVDFTFRIGAL